MTHVYLVIPEGISKHSPVAVASTRQEATQIAEKLWAESDGYHTFAIEYRRIGKVYKTVPLKASYNDVTTKPPQIDQVPELHVTYP